MTEFNESGSKYLRELRGLVGGKADVYAVLVSFGVTCPARQHAIKKLLFAGQRGKADERRDVSEARDAVDRALQLIDELLAGSLSEELLSEELLAGSLSEEQQRLQRENERWERRGKVDAFRSQNEKLDGDLSGPRLKDYEGGN